MKNNSRRNFLKFSCLAGLSMADGGILKGFATELQNNGLFSSFLKPKQQPLNSPIRDLCHSVLHYDAATYCGHPRMVGFHYFGEGEILVGHFHAPSYYKVYTDVRHVAYQARSVCLFQRSMDGGRTWPKENEQIIFDRLSFCENPEELFSRTGDRENYDMFRPESIFFSQNTYELDPPLKCFFLRSPDKGKTWEKIPTVVKNPYGEKLSITRHNTPVIRMPDGKTLLASFHVDTYINTGDGKELGGETVIFSSTDQGISWQFLSRPIIDPTGDSSFGYQTLLLLPSGELQCYVLNSYRKSETVQGMQNAICMVRSQDGGKTWSEGIPISGKGLDIWKNPGKSGVLYRSPWPILLKDGRILIVFARRRMPTGIGGIISADGGKTCSPDFIIRDDGKRWNEEKHEEGDWGDLGYPVGCQLDDGQIFIAYYFNNKDVGRNPQGGTRYIAASMFRI
ncbi:MAG: sialidase family protein [Mangrovibacterium sp.]